jgi:hypothetical protein
VILGEYIHGFDGSGVSPEMARFIQMRRAVQDAGETWGNMLRVVREYKRVAGAVRDRASSEMVGTFALSHYADLLEQIERNARDIYWNLDWFERDLTGREGRSIPENPDATIYDKARNVWRWAEKAVLEAAALNEIIRHRGTSNEILIRDIRENLVRVPARIVAGAVSVAGESIFELLKRLPWWAYAVGGVAAIGGIMVLRRR